MTLFSQINCINLKRAPLFLLLRQYKQSLLNLSYRWATGAAAGVIEFQILSLFFHRLCTVEDINSLAEMQATEDWIRLGIKNRAKGMNNLEM